MNRLALVICMLLVTFFSACGLFRSESANAPIESLIGQSVDVRFSHDLDVLWLSNYSYSNLVLVSVDEDRAVFRDPSNKFLEENGSRLDGVDRFNYGAETMAHIPQVLPDGRFSVRLEDIESISKGGRVVWRNRTRT